MNDSGSQGGQVTLTASKGVMSRTHLGSDGKQTVWSEGDRIYVSSADGKVTGTLALSSEPGLPTGTFTGYVFGDPDKLDYSVFPVPKNGKTIDLSQVTGGDKIDAPMVGPINDGNVPFENTCGILRLNLQDANGKDFTISAKNATTDAAAQLYTTATVKVVNGVAKLEYTSSSDGTIALNNAVGGFMYVPYFINEDVDVYVDDIEVATIEKEKEVNGVKVDFIGAIKQEEVKTLVYSKTTSSLIEPVEVSINQENIQNTILTLNVSSATTAPDQGGDSSPSTQESHEFVNIPSITEALTGEGDEEVEVTSVVVELPKITETTTATKSVVSFEEIPQGVTVTIQEENSSTSDKTVSVEELTVILPSGTTSEEAKQAVNINMPNTTVTVKSADGNVLLIEAMTAETADQTLIIDKDVEITSLTIKKGSVQVFGKIGQLKRDPQNSDAVTEVIIEIGGEVKQTVGQDFNVVNKNVADEPVAGDVVFKNVEFSSVLKEVLGNDVVTINSQGYAVMKKTDVENVKVLNLGIMVGNNKYLPSLSGIENFTNLEEFYFRNEGSSLTSIDFSKNVKLKNLQLVFANPGTLDLSKNVNLESLLLVHMHINSLDLSKNVKLKSINLDECHLTSLDITALSSLDDLRCNNQLDENFSKGIDLTVTMTRAQMELWNSKWKENNKDRVTAVVEGGSTGGGEIGTPIASFQELQDALDNPEVTNILLTAPITITTDNYLDLRIGNRTIVVDDAVWDDADAAITITTSAQTDYYNNFNVNFNGVDSPEERGVITGSTTQTGKYLIKSTSVGVGLNGITMQVGDELNAIYVENVPCYLGLNSIITSDKGNAIDIKANPTVVEVNVNDASQVNGIVRFLLHDFQAVHGYERNSIIVGNGFVKTVVVEGQPVDVLNVDCADGGTIESIKQGGSGVNVSPFYKQEWE